jgi:hypothetical protein
MGMSGFGETVQDRSGHVDPGTAILGAEVADPALRTRALGKLEEEVLAQILNRTEYGGLLQPMVANLRQGGFAAEVGKVSFRIYPKHYKSQATSSSND